MARYVQVQTTEIAKVADVSVVVVAVQAGDATMIDAPVHARPLALLRKKRKSRIRILVPLMKSTRHYP
jgi:hypothetical protein